MTPDNLIPWASSVCRNHRKSDFPVAMKTLICSKRTAPKGSPCRRPSGGKKRTPLQPQCVLGMEPGPETKLKKGLRRSFPAFETTGLTSPNALWLQRRAFLGPIRLRKRRRSRRPPEGKKGTPLQPQCVREAEPGPKTKRIEGEINEENYETSLKILKNV